MTLANDLVSQFVKVTRDEVEVKVESTVYGTIVEHDGSKYVRLDGSDLLTPISSTTDVADGERVTVMIKDHTAVVTGNISSPSASSSSVQEIGNKITEVEILIADKVSTKEFDSVNGRVNNLISENVTIKEQLTANAADIDNIKADNVTINEKLTAHAADIEDLETHKLTATDADLKYAAIGDLEAIDISVRNIEGDYSTFKQTTTDKLEAVEAEIGKLDADFLTAETADLRYANIDFSNIGEAAIEYFYATSGLIKDVVIEDGTIAGHLVGVTISGDLIEGNTIVAEKLVIKGEDGLYYQLNTDGMTTETEQTEYNSLNGSIIMANSITATKINVDDLVAFDATIGGFNITDSTLYSGVKSTVDNTTRGIYLDKNGQIAFGDSNNYIKFYEDVDGTHKLTVAAASISFGAENTDVEEIVNEINSTATDAVNTSTANAGQISTAIIDIDSIKMMISSLVTGENGETLMTQTDSGWTFNIASMQKALNDATAEIGAINSELNSVDSVLDSLNSAVSDLGVYTEYIKFGVDNGKPCIILGETDSAFKVLITNTDIRFMEGSAVPAYISNRSLHVEKAVISEELKQGGFVWMARSNGNYGLMWKGGIG